MLQLLKHEAAKIIVKIQKKVHVSILPASRPPSCRSQEGLVEISGVVFRKRIWRVVVWCSSFNRRLRLAAWGLHNPPESSAGPGPPPPTSIIHQLGPGQSRLRVADVSARGERSPTYVESIAAAAAAAAGYTVGLFGTKRCKKSDIHHTDMSLLR